MLPQAHTNDVLEAIDLAIITIMISKAQIKAFAKRDWEKISELDSSYWAEEYRRNGAESSLKAAEALRHHMKLLHPEWPDEAQRAADLQHHIKIKRLLDQAANGLKSY